MSLPPASAREGADLAFLTGAGAGDILRSALPAGVVMRSWQVHSQHHRPGAGVSVGYAVVLDEPCGGGGYERRETYMCASTARLTRRTGVVSVNLGGITVNVWEFPADPELPALARACSQSTLSEAIGRDVSVELLGYRPTRRAVVRAKDDEGVVAFAKVVRPNQVEALSSRYAVLSRGAVPSPALLFTDPDGLVVTSCVDGVPLANALSRGLGVRAPGMFRALVRALDGLPEAVTRFRRRPAWSDRAEHYAHAAATVLPQDERRCFQVAHDVFTLMDESDPGPVVPVHGDFYEANVFVDPSQPRITGLIDVDSIGPGYRVDDLACMLGHMSVLPHLAPASYPHVVDDLRVWVDQAEKLVDPVALNARCAGVVLSLVAGAKRQGSESWQEDARGRLSTAEAWIERAESWLAVRRQSA
ncbi:phosphotransferase [Arcanobacterium haemolyticum]|nr:phosphotransferase [Arcanobacterium haemolyticum]